MVMNDHFSSNAQKRTRRQKRLAYKNKKTSTQKAQRQQDEPQHMHSLKP